MYMLYILIAYIAPTSLSLTNYTSQHIHSLQGGREAYGVGAVTVGVEWGGPRRGEEMVREKRE